MTDEKRQEMIASARKEYDAATTDYDKGFWAGVLHVLTSVEYHA